MVGSKVIITDRGHEYTTWQIMFDEFGITDAQRHSKENFRDYLDYTYSIEAYFNHPDYIDNIVCVLSSNEGCRILIGDKGISKADNILMVKKKKNEKANTNNIRF